MSHAITSIIHLNKGLQKPDEIKELREENPAGTTPSIQERHKNVYVDSNILPALIFRPSLFLLLQSFIENKLEQASALNWKVCPKHLKPRVVSRQSLSSHHLCKNEQPGRSAS